FHLIRRFYQSAALTALAFSLDGGVLYALDTTGLIIFDPETGRTVKRFTYPATVGAYGIAGVQRPQGNVGGPLPIGCALRLVFRTAVPCRDGWEESHSCRCSVDRPLGAV